MYTVLVGLIPIIMRLLVWSVTRSGTAPALAATDFIAFGIVLHIANINELEHAQVEHRAWKTIQNGMSIVFLALYSALSATLIVAERQPSLVDGSTMQTLVIVLASTSLLLSFSVFHRLSRSGG